MIRRTLACALILTLCWTGWVWAAGPAFAQETTQELSTEGELEQVDEFRDLLDELRSDIDRSQFDLEALLDKLDHDADNIIQFVKEEISFEAYLGLLRGAQGTLMSRAGNSLDQAVLLATLLKDAGDDARILQTNLSASQVRLLMARIGSQPRQKESAAQDTSDEAWVLAKAGEIDRTAQSILTALERSDVSLGSPQFLVEVLEEARDYFWVEHRLGPSQPWVSVHPAFSDTPKELESLEYSALFSSSVPAELQHRLRVQAFIEQKVGRELRVHPIMDPWERPTANLVAESLSFANLPSGLTPETFGSDWDTILQDTALFLPIFNGQLAPGGKAFDLNGIPFDLTSMGMDGFSAAPLFQTVGEKVEGAVGALGALGGDSRRDTHSEPMTLTAQWLEYTLTAPGGGERTYRRTLLDRLGPSARQANDLSKLEPLEPRNLVTTVQLMAPSGRLSDDFLTDRLLESAKQAYYFSQAMTPGLERWGQSAEARSVLQARSWSLAQLALVGAIQQSPPSAMDIEPYRSGPGLMAIQHWVSGDDSIHGVVDIITNPRRAFRIARGELEALPERVLAQGIWETFAEGVALTEITAEPVSHSLQKAGRLGSSLSTIEGSKQIATLSWPPDVGTHMLADLDRGYVVVAPVEPKSTTWDGPAWWRVDPTTGEALGIHAGGWGGLTTEEIILTILVGVFLAAIVIGVPSYVFWRKCGEKHPANVRAQKCCYKKRFFAAERDASKGLGVDRWVRAIDAMETQRAAQCEGLPPPRPTRP